MEGKRTVGRCDFLEGVYANGELSVLVYGGVGYSFFFGSC